MTARQSMMQFARSPAVHRTLGGVVIVAGVVAMAVTRRHALHDAAARDWERRSLASLQLASSAAHAWAAEREAGARLLGASAARNPAIFQGPAALRPPLTAEALSQRLATTLTSLNQMSGKTGGAFSELWLMNRSGALVGSASPRVPPSIIDPALRAALQADSLIVVGPFRTGDNRIEIAFVQAVQDRSPEHDSSGAAAQVVGAVVLASRVDAALLSTLGVALPGSAREPTTLVARVRDSVYEYALSPQGLQVHAWDTAKAPALQRAALDRPAGRVPARDASMAAVTAPVDGLPWGLERRANTATLFVAADASSAREVSTVIVLLSGLLWLALARGHRERERHLHRLAASEARYRLLADHSTDIIARHAPDGRVLYVSPAVQAVLGYAPGDIEGTYPFALRHDDDTSLARTAAHRAFSVDEPVRAEHRIRHADGHFVWLETVGRALRDPATGAVTEFISTSRDIADAKAAEEALRVSEEQYRLMFEANPMPMWTFDVGTGMFLAVNDAAVAHYGYSRNEFLRMTVFDIRPPEHVAAVRNDIARRQRGITTLRGRRHRKKDGTLIDVDLTLHRLPIRGRETLLVLVTDVTEKNRIESALRESNEFARAIFVSSPIAIVASDLDLRVLQWNHAAERLFGWSADEIVGRQNPLTPDETTRPGLGEIHETLLRTGRVTDLQERLPRKDGTFAEVNLSLAVMHDAHGEPAGIVALAVDLSERARLEAQLRHSQKLEAVGQLAGGVAHDFNNLLTVITTYTELLLADLPYASPACDDVTEIKGAAERAAVLTRQLLAFSRQQVLQPRVLQLNTVVQGLEQMLRRVLPSSIQIETSLAADLGAVNADPGQLEQVVMNLIVNARDAMPDGGTLTIETCNVDSPAEIGKTVTDADPDSFVRLTVSDTGLGMTPEVQARIFEPFYTTKEIGQGTGLGLSTAHGIVTQSGGHLTVHSAPGRGARFSVYLPRAAAEAPHATPARDMSGVAAGTEVVLLVEDEMAVRAATTRVLERAGYVVLTACDGAEALTQHAQHASSIRVVITDMIMPAMNGVELAAALHARCPGLPVVFMTGYTDRSVLAPDDDEESVMLLHKPFTPEALTRLVREALQHTSHPAGAQLPVTA